LWAPFGKANTTLLAKSINRMLQWKPHNTQSSKSLKSHILDGQQKASMRMQQKVSTCDCKQFYVANKRLLHFPQEKKYKGKTTSSRGPLKGECKKENLFFVFLILFLYTAPS